MTSDQLNTYSVISVFFKHYNEYIVCEIILEDICDNSILFCQGEIAAPKKYRQRVSDKFVSWHMTNHTSD